MPSHARMGFLGIAALLASTSTGCEGDLEAECAPVKTTMSKVTKPTAAPMKPDDHKDRAVELLDVVKTLEGLTIKDEKLKKFVGLYSDALTKVATAHIKINTMTEAENEPLKVAAWKELDTAEKEVKAATTAIGTRCP